MSEPDFREYLDSICENAQDWWKKSARFIKEIDDSTWFSFELKVKKPDTPKQKPEVDKEKNPPQLVLDVLKGTINEPVLLVGNPGAGKSTLLARVLVEKAQQALEHPNAPIPVLVDLNLYGASGIWGLIQTALESQELYLEVAEIKQLMKEKRLLLLADGVNELSEKKFRTELKNFCCRKPAILTTRDFGGDLGIALKLEIQPLTSQVIATFLRDRLPNHNRNRVQELCARVRDFGQTPLMVWMLYSIFSQNGEIPATRGEAYRAFTTLYEERAKEGIDLQGSRPLLATLAFEMMQSEKPTELRLDLSEVEAQKLVGGEKVLKTLLSNHLLQRFGQPKDYRIRFCHQSLQEYYAAEKLLELLPSLSDDELKQDYLNYLKWTEAIALMLGLLDKKAQSLKIVELAMKVDLMLGAVLAGEVKPMLQKKAINLIRELDLSDAPKVHLLGINRSKEAIEYLFNFLEDKDYNVRWITVIALKKISSETAIPKLIQKLEDPKAKVYRAVAEALGEIAPDEASKEVIKQLKNCDLDISKLARLIEILGYIGSNFSLASLFKLLEHPEFGIRQRAIEALGQIGSETAIPKLLQRLNSSDIAIRIKCAEALGRIGSERSIPELLKQLDDSNIILRGQSSEALGKIGSIRAVPKLLRKLEDSDFYVRWKAGNALIQINSKLAISRLVQYLKDPDPDIRGRAAIILGQIAPKTMNPELNRLLKDPDPEVCRKVNIALGRTNFEIIVKEKSDPESIIKAVPKLLQQLKNPDSIVHQSAAIFLRRIIWEIDEDQLFKYIVDLRNLISFPSYLSALSILFIIQKRCGFYNYEIAQAAVEEGKREKEGFTKSSIISDDELYADILTTIFNSGRNIESSPKEIRSLDEESLRHILIHAVNAKYSNMAEAEAYNKGGKTDILVRINGEKILIAECKIWHGEDGLAKALDQLLQRYVTWRDTKLALLIFSRNQEFSAVVQKIPQQIKQHQYFVREGDHDSKEAWFRFVVCHPHDRDRELTLTVLAFDIPS